ncbi:MAG TPA: DNA gyrase subunit A, partial [Anaerolineaceae bacterium]
TELPYQVNKSALIERIAELVREGNLEGIADLRDESDRQGMRIVIELSKTADPEKILRGLYKHTPMQTTFGIIMLALVDNEPHLLSLKQALRVYLDHRQVVVRRRSEYELARARARAHILEGLLVALKNLDAVIELIRNSPDAEQARLRLIKRFKLTEIQAQAILDLPLRRLAALERKKIEQEYKDIAARIKELESLLKSPKRMRQVVADELNQMKQAYGDARRTHIVNVKEGSSATMLLTTTDVTPAETVWVGVTPAGAIVRAPEEELETLLGTLPPLWLIRANTHHTLYLVSCEGKAAAIPVHAVPEASKTPAGLPVSKVSPLTDEEVIAGMFALPPKNGEAKDETILTVSRMGMVKKSAVSELPGPSAHAFALARVNEGDELVAVKVTDGKSEILLGTVQGMAIRFKEEEIRPMGLAAAGVGGIKLAADDEVVDAVMLTAARELCFVASDGKAKRIPLKDFPLQGRYGQGVQAWKLARGARLVGLENPAGKIKALAHFIDGSAVQFDLEKIPQRYRAGQGETVVRPPTGESLIAVGFIPGGEKPPAEKPPRLPGSDGSGPDRKPSPDEKTSGSPAKSRTATKKTDTAWPKTAARAPKEKKTPAAAPAKGTVRAGVKKAVVKETALKPAEKKPASARRKRANPADEQLSLGFDPPPVDKPGKKPAARPAATPVQPAAVKPKPTLKREKKPLPAARPAKAGPPVPESKVKTKKVSGDKTPAPPEPETPQPARRKSTPREH